MESPYDWSELIKNNNLSSLCKRDLKIYLRSNALETNGDKDDLIERIKDDFNIEFEAVQNKNRSVFRHHEDHKQFKHILSSIRDCEIIKLLDVPVVISTLIAIYSMGYIVRCLERNCNKEIAFTHEYYAQYNNKRFCSICNFYTEECPACDNFICLNYQCENHPMVGENYYCVKCALIFCSTESIYHSVDVHNHKYFCLGCRKHHEDIKSIASAFKL